MMALFHARVLILSPNEEEELHHAIGLIHTLSTPAHIIQLDQLANLTRDVNERALIVCPEDFCQSEMMATVNTRKNVWLMSKKNAENVAQSVNLSLDSLVVSYEDDVFYEHYGIKNEVQVENYLGKLANHRFDLVKPAFIWERRANLRNVTFINSGLFWLPFFSSENQTDAIGFMPDILAHFQSTLNFSIFWLKPDDGKWGNVDDKSGEWTGIVRDLLDGRAQMGCSGMSMSYERASVIDFTMGVMDEVNTLIILKSNSPPSVNAASYVNIFSLASWLTYFLLLVLLALCLSLTLAQSEMPMTQVLNAFLFSITATLLSVIQLDSKLPNPTMSLKWMNMIVALTTFFFYQLYVSNLTAQMTASESFEDIRSFDDLRMLGYTMLLPEGTISHAFAQEADQDSAMGRVYKESTELISVQGCSTICLVSCRATPPAARRSQKALLASTTLTLPFEATEPQSMDS